MGAADSFYDDTVVNVKKSSSVGHHHHHHHLQGGNSSHSIKPRRSLTYSRNSTISRGSSAMILVSVYFMVFLSWMTHYGYTRRHEALWTDLEYDIADQQEASAQTRIHASKIQTQVVDLLQRLSTLVKTQHALKHELRMLVEMQIEGVNMTMVKSGAENNPMNGFIERWMDQRQKGLLHRIALLENQVQNSSKATVLEKYGPGPHRVQFKVQVETSSNKDQLQALETDDAMWHNMISKPLKSFTKTSRSKVTRSFVVQLAPVDEVPHALHFFLDMIQNGLWDDALFLHHEKVDHVMAAAPMDYKTHNIRYDELNDMGWQKGLGFPEFSKSLPHDKYTLGFADRGPTFYINTMDNSDIHGPGGQGHHVLPEDADPCFGRIVEGQDVVDALITYGLKADNRLKITGAHPWKDSDHSWSRLVSAKLL
jgi:Cyclophilin type peptidyl-prolyl cis-trans isomerase/CLD